jgi:hypothetical protein
MFELDQDTQPKVEPGLTKVCGPILFGMIIPLDQPDRCGRVYTVENFRDHPDLLYVTLGRVAGSVVTHIGLVCGKVNKIAVTSNILKVDWHPLPTKTGETVKDILRAAPYEKSRLSPVGVGNVDANGYVWNYTLIGFELILAN